MNMIEYVYMTCAGRIENIANMQIEETCGNLNVKRKLTFARNGHWTKAAGRTKATCFPSRESASVGSGDLDTEASVRVFPVGLWIHYSTGTRCVLNRVWGIEKGHQPT